MNPPKPTQPVDLYWFILSALAIIACILAALLHGIPWTDAIGFILAVVGVHGFSAATRWQAIPQTAQIVSQLQDAIHALAPVSVPSTPPPQPSQPPQGGSVIAQPQAIATPPVTPQGQIQPHFTLPSNTPPVVPVAAMETPRETTGQ